METSQFRKFILILLIQLTMSACDSTFRGVDPYPGVEIPTPDYMQEYGDYPALAWESKASQEEKNQSLKEPTYQQRWTNYLYYLIDQEAPNLIEGASDIANFCPRYKELERREKVSFWGALIAEMTRYESGFNTKARMAETGRIDEIQGTQLYSEGLLQLSYQDTKWMPKCQFNWNVDRYLDAQDERKTIFNPYLNLQCGVYILNRQQRNKGGIVRGDGAYWAVLKSTYSRNKIKEITVTTKALSFCKKPAPKTVVKGTL
jgi:hypothetical protein